MDGKTKTKMRLEFLGLYMALAALFYLRLTATAATDAAVPINKPSSWHRARRLTKTFLRRSRLGLPKE